MFARRNFLFGLTAVCAPAVIRTPKILMPLGRGLLSSGEWIEMRDTAGETYLVPLEGNRARLTASIRSINMLPFGRFLSGRVELPLSIDGLQTVGLGNQLTVTLRSRPEDILGPKYELLTRSYG